MGKTIIIFDCETTGFGSDDRLVQLAWLVHDSDGKELKSQNHIIKPVGFEIPIESTKIHGITTQEALDGGEDLKEVIDKFMSDIKEYECWTMVGHNIDFDKRMITYELARLGTASNFDLMTKICTMNKSKDYCALPSSRKGYKQPKLQELYVVLFGEEFEDAHNAFADVHATAKCYWELKKRGIINPISM